MRLLYLCMACIVIAFSCTKPVLIGSDFLDDEKASLNFRDDFGLNFYTEITDSVIVHSDNVTRQLSTYLLGNLNDPIFGTSTAEIYAQPLLSTAASDLFQATLDSVVLHMRYDDTAFYGSITDPVTIEVYRMTENPNFNTVFNSDDSFLYDPQLLGSKTFIPHPDDSIDVVRPTGTARVYPQVRIALNTTLLNDFTTQSDTTYIRQDSFLRFFNGLYIRMVDSENTILGFNLLNSDSGLSFYYHKAAGTKTIPLIFTSASVKVVNMQHDYTGSYVESSLTPDPEINEWFVQGMSGLTTRMTIDDLDELGNAIINQAELEVYCTFPTGDNPLLYPPIENLVTQELTDTAIVNSQDVNAALFRTNGNFRSPLFESVYGGKLQKISTGNPAVYRYNMKVTSQVKEIFEGKKENIIYFNPYLKANVPNRSVMFGPAHPDYAPRLRIYYTSI